MVAAGGCLCCRSVAEWMAAAPAFAFYFSNVNIKIGKCNFFDKKNNFPVLFCVCFASFCDNVPFFSAGGCGTFSCGACLWIIRYF